MQCFTCQAGAAWAPCVLQPLQRQLRGCVALADEATQSVLPDGLAGCPARQPGHFSCFAKRSRQEKATLRWRSALRADCTRRQHLKREASETRFAQTADASFSVSGTGDASPSNGISLQRQRQLQMPLPPQPQPQPQPSLRGALFAGLRLLHPAVSTNTATASGPASMPGGRAASATCRY